MSRITTRFFHVSERNEGCIPFPEALRIVEALPIGAARERDVSDARIRIETLQENNGLFEGEAVRIRAEDFPSEVTDEGLEVIDADRIGFGVAFAYHSRLNILAIQYDVRRVSPARLGEYLRRFNELAEYNIHSVPKTGAWQEFNAGSVRWFQVRLALPNEFDMDSEIPMADELNALARAYEAPQITIRLSLGRKKGNLLDRIKDSANTLLGRADVESMKAKTVESGEEINLMDELLYVRDNLDLSNPNPDENYVIRRDFVRQSLHEHMDYLAQQYG